MGAMFVKCKLSVVFFLLICASLLSSSSYVAVAGRYMSVQEAGSHGSDTKHEDAIRKTAETMREMEERLLRANTKDYGRYDPSPTFVKPPFKLIPN